MQEFPSRLALRAEPGTAFPHTEEPSGDLQRHSSHQSSLFLKHSVGKLLDRLWLQDSVIWGSSASLLIIFPSERRYLSRGIFKMSFKFLNALAPPLQIQLSAFVHHLIMCFHTAISECAISTSVLKPSRNFSLKQNFAVYYCYFLFHPFNGLFVRGPLQTLLSRKWRFPASCSLSKTPWQARASSPLSHLLKAFYLVLTKTVLQ